MRRTSEIQTALSALFFLVATSSARAQDGEDAEQTPVVTLPRIETTEAEARDLAPGHGALTDDFEEAQDIEWSSPDDEEQEDPEAEDPRYTPISLPGGETRTAANPQAISLPTGEGSIEGMGESFSPILSSGTATFTVPISVAPGRAGVQPSLALSYSSSGGNGPVGFGWSVAVPSISRQTDRGLPSYDDRPLWHPGEDRFIYNGGQELVPVSTSAMAIVDQQAAPTGTASTVPSDVVGWQQYRARVEGGFMRFFRAPDQSRWVVQSPDGTRFDFGRLPVGTYASDLDTSRALEVDDEGRTRVFRWMLTRSADSHGSTIYYSYTRDRGQVYLIAIHYISPATAPVNCAAGATVTARRECTATLARYGARIGLVYEPREDAFTTYTSGYPVTTAQRIRRIEVTAYDDGTAQRTLVRRYHLRYDATSFHSVLSSVQVEGRPSILNTTYNYEEGVRSITESSLTDAMVGSLLPPMRFGYTRLPEGTGSVAGFGALSSRVRDIAGSPPHSIDEGRAELMDVNSDGLLDLVVTAPSLYPTSDGAPAAGVFFNGFSGRDARVGAPAQFSEAVPVPMRGDLVTVMSFTNANIVPMDIDGDGRGDLLHMPRHRSYGWFTPTRRADPPTGTTFTSPARQGWRFSYAEIDLPPGDLDPRIDLGGDGQHLQVIDVNNDHLIDVVRTSGTVMQTWLNLGWLEGGDGRFGSYTLATDGTPELSTEPYESCVLRSGTNIDFESPEVRFADMNGDGLQDIVEIQRGRVRWWPGRGVGSWGAGPIDCGRGEGAGRYLEMANPPVELAVDLEGVQLADVDGDGATDVVQIRFDAIDVWFNRAGTGFTPRHIVRGTPAAPSFLNRVRLVDIDASGTLDALYADGGNWRYVDLLSPGDGHPSLRPRLLTEVDNGLGALTTMDYESAATDYLTDLADAATCGSTCESFGWGRVDGDPSQRLSDLSGDPRASLYRAGGTPVISTVIRRVRTNDRFSALGREDQVSETVFAYHDGYYEGIEQEFRGFGVTDSTITGATAAETSHTRTWFNQGRRPQAIADDRLAFNPDEALKGREYLTEVFDSAFVFLSTIHASLTTRTLATGLDGRPIEYAFVSETNELRYDTTDYTPGAATVSVPSIIRQTVAPTTGAVIAASTDPARDVVVRGWHPVRIRTTYDTVDNRGQIRQQTAWGHVAVTGTQVATDPQIIHSVVPRLFNADGQWLWRTERTYLAGGDAPSVLFNDMTATFDADDGDPQTTRTNVEVPVYSAPYAGTLVFPGDPTNEGGAAAYTAPTDDDLEASNWHDVWGNSIAQCAGDALTGAAPSTPAGASNCLRFGTASYDATFGQFPISETIWVRPSGSLSDLTTTVPMSTPSDPGWDRGLGALRRVRDPNATASPGTYDETRAYQDGFGRASALTPPPVAGCASGVPTTTIRYFMTASGSSEPVSRIESTLRLTSTGCTFGDDVSTSVANSYVDGLGRTRAHVAQGEESGDWIRSGITQLDTKGQVVRAWQPEFYTGSETDLHAIFAAPDPLIPSTQTSFDPFGRTSVQLAEDGAPTRTTYHASSIDVCDPIDNTIGHPYYNTCTTSRSDGHGRVIDQILRQRVGTGPIEIHRLWSWHRADGQITWLIRALTTTEGTRPSDPAAAAAAEDTVEREFIHDSVGRRLTSRDPDTDDSGSTDPRSRSWRYLFNRIGDLVAVRDPRGCGQNFYYDLGGRLVGEQYVGCAEAQTSMAEQPGVTIPADSVALDRTVGTRDVDVLYEYDADPAWLSGSGVSLPGGSGGRLGRATGSRDRGQRSAVIYDQRGNPIWSARQMGLIAAHVVLPTGAFSGSYPSPTETAPTSATIAYDQAHTYVSSTQFDHAGRAHTALLPQDPDWGGTAVLGPAVSGTITYNRRGLPATAVVDIGSAHMVPGTTQTIVGRLVYDRDGAVTRAEYGGAMSAARVTSITEYDSRRRPTLMQATRVADVGALDDTLADVEDIFHQELTWDAADNLTAVDDLRPTAEWPAGHRPQTAAIVHDALYHVVDVEYDYPTASTTDVSSDWRTEAAASNAVDPMQPAPAPRVGGLPPNRVLDLEYAWDWQGNQTSWRDDADSFYERSIGAIVNGRDIGARPSALYLATNIPDSGGIAASWDGAGWVEVAYGAGGNVLSYTVHGECEDTTEPSSCTSGSSISPYASRIAHLQTNCTCVDEQHYQYRWDELNQLVEARRFERSGGAGSWTLLARMRYRYDGATQRVVTQTFSLPNTSQRVDLEVSPGHMRRRGVSRGTTTYDGVPGGTTATETQYLVAGARVVWDATSTPATPNDLDRNRRVTLAVTDVLQSTSAVVDLRASELLEASTYLPSGVRENLWASTYQAVSLEPAGFTGKEADEEVGATYFGARWLLPSLGRWASPDPLSVHAAGGGEALNAYHYVGGNLLQARDPLGLFKKRAADTGPHPQEVAASRRAAADTVSPSAIPQTAGGVYSAAGRRAAARAVPSLPSRALAALTGPPPRSEGDFSRAGPAGAAVAAVGTAVHGVAGVVRGAWSIATEAGEEIADSFNPSQGAIDLDRMEDGQIVDQVAEGIEDGDAVPMQVAVAAVSVVPMGGGAAAAAEELGAAELVEANTVGRYGQRAPGLERHHGVLDAWAGANVPGYVRYGAETPVVRLTPSAHDATRAVYRAWSRARTGRPVGARIDWSTVSAAEAQALAYRMFEAAGVPAQVQAEYFAAFHRYIYSVADGAQ